MRNKLGYKISALQAINAAWHDLIGFHGTAADIRGEIDQQIPLDRAEVYSRYLPEFMEVAGQVSPSDFARQRARELPDGCGYLELEDWLRGNLPDWR